MTTTALRPELPTMPPRVARLPIHRGYPVPWFVAWIDGEPDFRIMDQEKFYEALNQHRCWVCGGSLGRHLAYVIGPMCAVNRVSSEPPSHLDCATVSARACPFLSRPHMRRRDAGKPEGTCEAAGIPIMRNPGVALVWVTRDRVAPFRTPDGGLLFDIGVPHETLWFAHGRKATRAEVEASIDSGLPVLRAEAEKDGTDAVRELEAMTERAMALLPDTPTPNRKQA